MHTRLRKNTYASTPFGENRRWGGFLAALGLASGGALIFVSGAAAAAPPWAEKPYQYVVVDQDVRGILTEFGRNLGVPVVLTDKVRGRARGEIKAETASEFLKKVTEAQDLTWYFDGSILHVSADEEFATQIIDAGAIDGRAIERELDRLGVADPRFAIRATPNSSLIGVSGPPAFVAVVRETAERLKPPPRVAGDDPRVRVFRGGAQAEVVRTDSRPEPRSEPKP